MFERTERFSDDAPFFSKKAGKDENINKTLTFLRYNKSKSPKEVHSCFKY